MEALHRQLTHELERFDATPNSIETLFIGGGTPSTVPPELYEPVFKLLAPYLHPHAEITTEANPNSATQAWLKGMHDLGVNRVSFGVQSFNQKKLLALGRSHSPQQARESIHTAHELGFEHLSLDLIYNYHGDTQARLGSDIETACSLPIDHLSAYELTIEANTPFSATPEVRQSDDDLAFFVAKKITEHGFEHYEISNFGLHQSHHNIGYWKLKNYIGAGAGAVGFRHTTRYYPSTDIDAYLHDPLAITSEHLTPEELRTERLFLGLRSRVGIDTFSLPNPMRQRADLLTDEGKLLLENNCYYNPDFFLADELALFLLG
jgi:oxygen-independent coproporphyrinogen-3 oxidase